MLDEKLVKFTKDVQNGQMLDFLLMEYGGLQYQIRLCLSYDEK